MLRRVALPLLAAVALSFLPRIARADVCGDGLRGFFEACDDGNARDGDGCSGTCVVEPGYTCAYGNPQLVTLANAGFEAALSASDWKVLAGDTDWLNGGYAACYPPVEGVSSLDLNGSTRGAIGQSFATTPGARYTVTFMANANCVDAAGVSCSTACSRTLAVGVADDTAAADATDVATPLRSVEYDVHGHALVTPWQQLHFQFTAASAKTILFFSGTDPSAAGPMIDDVRMPVDYCWLQSCGDGVIDPGETCDDGNADDGDGCSLDCRHIEVGYGCPTPGAACVPVCGDGHKKNTEACDDGNTADFDGCAHDCKLEAGASCSVVPPDLKSVCACPSKPGFKPSCKDIDECAEGVGGDPTKKACLANQVCTNSPGSYACECETGYSGKGTPGAHGEQDCACSKPGFDPNTCKDIDECASATTCGANQECQNTQGAFVCSCRSGYAPGATSGAGGKSDCEDIDECAAPKACDVNATCTNKPGGFSCACNSQYVGDGQTCQRSGSCSLASPCRGANAQCMNGKDPVVTNETGYCQCPAGFEPDPSVTDEVVCRSTNKSTSRCSVEVVGSDGGDGGALAVPLAIVALGLGRRAHRRRR